MQIPDSSAVAIILKRLREKSIEILEDKVTLDLTRYELGNVVWKECALNKLISPEEAVNKAKDLAKILEVTKVDKVESSEDFERTMRLATELKLTFYDAVYLYIARSKGLTLITEDKELCSKARRVKIKAIRVDELLREQP